MGDEIQISRIQRGNSEEGLKPPRKRRFKYEDLIESCHRMSPGEWVDLAIAAGREMEKEKRAISRALDRYVRSEIPHYLFRARLTAKRQVRVSCHRRSDHGRLPAAGS